MTYARFLGLFVVLPILVLAVRYRRTLSWRGLSAAGHAARRRLRGHDARGTTWR